MAPPQDAKVENAVKFGVVRLYGQQNKPIQTKFGMQVYIGSLLQCGKLGHDRFRGGYRSHTTTTTTTTV